ncbi:MAG: DUF4383 domain-containing protein [Nitrospiraceae bacterium]
MTTRNFVLTIGIFYLLIGLLGFFPAAVSAPPPGAASVTTIDSVDGYLLGLFPVNALHRLVHLMIGIWGIGVYRSLPKSITFSRGLAIIFGALAVMGLIPALNTTFGLIPIFGHAVWLHAATAAIAAYFGYARAVEVAPLEWEARRAS